MTLSTDLMKALDEKIASYRKDASRQHVGTIVEVGDGIAKIQGLSHIGASEMIDVGNGVYGVQAAAQKYFGVSAQSLSTYQAALLAGLLKAPSRYNPIANPGSAADRTEQVLANMVAAGYLSRLVL